MTPDENPPSREELAEDVAARMRAAGLDAASDGENVTVREPARTAASDGASTGKNVATVIGASLGSAALGLLASLIWFVIVFLVLGVDTTGAGQRAGAIGFTIAALFGGGTALFAGFGARTPAGNRDMAALILGIVLGVPLLLVAVRSLGMTLDALTRDVGKLGLIAGLLFFSIFSFVGDRLFRKRQEIARWT